LDARADLADRLTLFQQLDRDAEAGHDQGRGEAADGRRRPR
jgi:hypothetical protein